MLANSIVYTTHTMCVSKIDWPSRICWATHFENDPQRAHRYMCQYGTKLSKTELHQIADESCLTTWYKPESYFWKSSLNENVETQCKRCRNLVRFGVWGQITQLVRKTKLSPTRAEQRGLSYFTQFHSELTQCIAENFLPQRFASESHTSHFWSGVSLS